MQISNRSLINQFKDSGILVDITKLKMLSKKALESPSIEPPDSEYYYGGYMFVEGFDSTRNVTHYLPMYKAITLEKYDDVIFIDSLETYKVIEEIRNKISSLRLPKIPLWYLLVRLNTIAMSYDAIIDIKVTKKEQISFKFDYTSKEKTGEDEITVLTSENVNVLNFVGISKYGDVELLASIKYEIFKSSTRFTTLTLPSDLIDEKLAKEIRTAIYFSTNFKDHTILVDNRIVELLRGIEKNVMYVQGETNTRYYRRETSNSHPEDIYVFGSDATFINKYANGSSNVFDTLEKAVTSVFYRKDIFKSKDTTIILCFNEDVVNLNLLILLEEVIACNEELKVVVKCNKSKDSVEEMVSNVIKGLTENDGSLIRRIKLCNS